VADCNARKDCYFKNSLAANKCITDSGCSIKDGDDITYCVLKYGCKITTDFPVVCVDAACADYND